MSTTSLDRYARGHRYAVLLKCTFLCSDLNTTYIFQLLQVFDSWAGELSPYDFYTFSYPSLHQISTQVRQKIAAESLPDVPLILFAKGANHAIRFLAENSGYDVLGLDWVIDPAEARKIVNEVYEKGGRKKKVALQGNMDPNVLYGGKDAIEAAVKRMAEGFGKGGGWIANLGHGITPGVDPEDLKWFFECVQKYSTAT